MKRYTVKQYMNAIEFALRVDRKTRVRIMNDLASDFQSRRDAGQSDEQIMAELGMPRDVAAEFNAAFAEEHGVWQTPWRWLWLALAITVLLLCILLPAGMGTPVPAPDAGSIGIIGVADGPTAIFVTGTFGLPSLVTLLPWIVGFFSLFLMGGWCRRDKGRLWLPVVLCALAGVWGALWQLLSAFASAQFGALPVWMYFTVNLLTSGTVFALAVLIFALIRLRKQ